MYISSRLSGRGCPFNRKTPEASEPLRGLVFQPAGGFPYDMAGSHSDKKDIMAQHVLVSIAQFGVRSIIGIVAVLFGELKILIKAVGDELRHPLFIRSSNHVLILGWDLTDFERH